MKTLLALIIGLTLTGCVAYAEPPVYPGLQYGTVTICDDYGCRTIPEVNYFVNYGTTYYWDVHFGVWIGSNGYWRNGYFYRGYHPKYHEYYHRGWYNHSTVYHKHGNHR